MQRAWKKSMSQETWARSFDVLHSGGAERAQQLSMSPMTPVILGPAQTLCAEGEAGESMRCVLGGGSVLSCSIANSFVLPKPQSRLRGNQRNWNLFMYSYKASCTSTDFSH